MKWVESGRRIGTMPNPTLWNQRWTDTGSDMSSDTDMRFFGTSDSRVRSSLFGTVINQEWNQIFLFSFLFQFIFSQVRSFLFGRLFFWDFWNWRCTCVGTLVLANQIQEFNFISSLLLSWRPIYLASHWLIFSVRQHAMTNRLSKWEKIARENVRH